VEFEHDPGAQRYRLTRAGETISLADYRPLGDGTTLEFHHTLTMPEHRGHGHAAELVRWALDDVRASGRHVVPSCWFVRGFIDRHPEYAELLISGTGRDRPGG
jgi:predicted GNAT family acetyltransferase